MSTVLLISAGAAGGWNEALEDAGIDVLSAKALTDGVKRLREGGIDLVVVAAQDDQAALEEFVSELERLPDPPPFLLASSSPGAPELSAHLGAVGFLAEPCCSAEMTAAVKRALPGTVAAPMDDAPTQPKLVKLFPG